MATTERFGAWTPFRKLDLSTTGQVVKASAGQVGGWYLSNSDTVSVTVKLYDKATAPTVADTPKLSINLPASAAANLLSDSGIDFAAGIALRASQGVLDSDTVATTSNTCVANLLFR